MNEFKIGDIVWCKESHDMAGIIAHICENGICLIDTGDIIKFPAKPEWIELIPDKELNNNPKH